MLEIKVSRDIVMENAKPLSKPLSMHIKLSKDEYPKSYDEKEFMNKILYQFAIGSLMYAMITTRSNIAFAIGVVCRFLSNLGKKLWEVEMILNI